MPLDQDRIAQLLQPYIVNASATSIDWPRVYRQLAVYLDLLLKWNSRMNLTAIRSPEEIVRRHFGESIFAGQHLGGAQSNSAAPPEPSASLLDFGSGAGFPGLPIQILWPKLRVTLAEARHRKASFLREAVRVLSLSTEIWADRVENMPPNQSFTTITMRAVDDMDLAAASAGDRKPDELLILGTRGNSYPALEATFFGPIMLSIPETRDGVLMRYRRLAAQS
jgi:16S rRNA (guanine527-N7)-methyltransferase